MRQFLDGKHNSKLAATVSINLRHSFKFFTVNDNGVAVVVFYGKSKTMF